INVTMRDIKSKNVYSRVNSKATTQWRKTESANGVHLEGVASDNRSSFISSFGGKTSYDADNRPLLVMRSNLWASGYDVDGTDQTSLGQFSGRVQQTYKHSVPRFFVPEHGTMFTLALV